MIHSHSIFSTLSASAYADASALARFLGDNMISRLELVTMKPKIILDVGCATGYCSGLLKQYYPQAHILALDNIEEMVRYAFARQIENVMCADARSLPLKNQSVDLIFANLLLPWCQPWESLFQEWRRILRPEGLLVFTCFGPDTLREFKKTDLEFLMKDMHEIGDALMQAKFSDPVMDVEYISFQYRDRKKLFYELEMSGMLHSASEKEYQDNDKDIFPITYEIIYGHAWGPNSDVDCVADEEGIIKIPLSHLRRRII